MAWKIPAIDKSTVAHLDEINSLTSLQIELNSEVMVITHSLSYMQQIDVEWDLKMKDS